MADDEDDDRYGEPRVSDGPDVPDPLIATWPQRADVVFVDTSTVLSAHRFPLLILARWRRLHIFWSPYVVAEVARVATREQAIQSVKRGSTRTELAADLEARRHVIDEAIEHHEAAWDSPAATAMARQYVSGRVPRLADRKDQAVLTAGLAVDAHYLLSTDRPSFGHLKRFESLVCWHPDTFLTAFFRRDREAYVAVCQEMEG